MNQLSPEIKIFVIGSQHGKVNSVALPAIELEAQKRFIVRAKDGTTRGNNLFFQECYNGLLSMSRAFKGLMPNQSALNTYLAIDSPRLSSFDIAREASDVRSTPVQNRDYFLGSLVMVDGMREATDLVFDCERYPDDQVRKHERTGKATHDLIVMAKDSLLRGRSRNAIELYTESLTKETKPFVFRNRSIAGFVLEDVLGFSAKQTTVAVILIGDGHVQALTEDIKAAFAGASLDPEVTGLYVGPRSHRYDLLSQLIKNPQAKLDQRLVTVTLLHNIYNFIAPQVAAKIIDSDNWYKSLISADQARIDMLLRRIAADGLIDGISQFVKETPSES